MAGHAVESRRRRAGGTLAAFFLGSVAVHGVVLVALPGPGHERGLTNAATLEVVLSRAVSTAAVPDELAPRPIPRQPRPERRPAVASSEPQGAPSPVPPEPPEPRELEGASFAAESPGLPERAAAANESASGGGHGVARPQRAVGAAYLRNPAPSYPLASRRAGEEGTVTLRVRVSPDGYASRVAVEKSSGSPHLDAAALEAVKAWRFAPARRGVDAVESWMLVPIVFRLEDAS